jgi:nucleolar protein 53
MQYIPFDISNISHISSVVAKMPVLKPLSGHNPEAPQQFKQPSRKGKKAWRKNVDVTDVQKGLEERVEQIIQG